MRKKVNFFHIWLEKRVFEMKNRIQNTGDRIQNLKIYSKICVYWCESVSENRIQEPEARIRHTIYDIRYASKVMEIFSEFA